MVDQMGVAALGNAGGWQRDGGVEGGKRRKNWQKEEMGGQRGKAGWRGVQENSGVWYSPDPVFSAQAPHKVSSGT